jgi:hypothetical protein
VQTSADDHLSNLKTVGGNPVRVRVPSPAPGLNAKKRPFLYVRQGRFAFSYKALPLVVVLAVFAFWVRNTDSKLADLLIAAAG